MSLLADSLRGISVDCEDIPSYIADFAVQGSDGSVMLAEMGWWQGYWMRGNGIDIFTGPLSNTQGVWKMSRQGGRDAYLCAPEDNEVGVVAAARQWQDVDRGDYMAALLVLAKQSPEYDLGPWIEIWNHRPIRNLYAEAQRGYAVARPIARITLLNVSGRVLDVMAFDQAGRAATATSHPWLQTFANDWTAREDRMELESYLSWMMDKTPPGEYGLSSPVSTLMAGAVEDVAEKEFLGVVKLD